MTNHEIMNAYSRWSRGDDGWKEDEMHHFYDQILGNKALHVLQDIKGIIGQGVGVPV